MQQPFETQEQTPGFVIDSDSKAQWAMDKIKEAREDSAKWKAHYERAMSLIVEANEQTEHYMLELLAAYFATVPHHDTKTQSTYTLPGGVLCMKQQAPEYKRDPAALLAWAKANMPEAVKVKEEADWAAIKKVCASGTACIADTGEVVDGVEVIQREPVFSVTIK